MKPTPFEYLQGLDFDHFPGGKAITALMHKEVQSMRMAKCHGMSDQFELAHIRYARAWRTLHDVAISTTEQQAEDQKYTYIRKSVKRLKQKSFTGRTYFYHYVKNRNALGAFPADIHKFIAAIGERASPARIVEPLALVLDPNAAHWNGDTAKKVLKKRVAEKTMPKGRRA